MLALLLVGGIVYLVLGDLKEAIILVAFATMSIVITVVQETRTERVLEALRDLTSPRALVIRDGRAQADRRPRRRAGRPHRACRGRPGPGRRRALAVPRSAGRRIDSDRRIRARAQDRVARSLGSAAQRPGGDDLPQVFSGSLVVRGSGTRRGNRYRPAKRNRQDRPIAQPRSKTEPPRLQAQTRRACAGVRPCRRGGERAGGPALRHHARRLAGRRAGRHCARHVDAARKSFRSSSPSSWRWALGEFRGRAC